MSEVAGQKSAGYSVESAIQRMTTCKGLTHRPLRLTIRKTNPGGLTAHQTTEVDTIYSGIDWEAGQLVIHPATPLTELSPEDVAAIHKSAKGGQSWHAYQAYAKQEQRIAAARQETNALRALLFEIVEHIDFQQGAGKEGRDEATRLLIAARAEIEKITTA